jgi:phosphoribosylcarboxyaminoimidazole (NCAIR) mutase
MARHGWRAAAGHGRRATGGGPRAAGHGRTDYEGLMTMPGVVTKMTVVRCPVQLYRLGGLRLIVAVLRAKPGVPFLTVWMEVTNR